MTMTKRELLGDSRHKHNMHITTCFIAHRGVVSVSDLMQEFLERMTDSELGMIIKTLRTSKFIQFEGALIKYIERR